MDKLAHISWFQWLPFWRWRIVSIAESADEIPARLPRNGAVLIGTAAHPKWLAFDCPCRTGHRIMLNCDPARRPHWRIDSHRRLNIVPSVDSRRPVLRCHYFVRKGRVQWVKDELEGLR
jgi:hypothetical protein